MSSSARVYVGAASFAVPSADDTVKVVSVALAVAQVVTSDVVSSVHGRSAAPLLGLLSTPKWPVGSLTPAATARRAPGRR